MIDRLDISGVHTDLDRAIEKYVQKKIGGLDRYVPRSARLSLHVEVKLKEARAKDRRLSTCEVIMHLPHEIITASETTINMYAAIDIIEVKLKQQLRKYKDQHLNPKFYRHLFKRLSKNK